jgi:hypothetical protein
MIPLVPRIRGMEAGISGAASAENYKKLCNAGFCHIITYALGVKSSFSVNHF